MHIGYRVYVDPKIKKVSLRYLNTKKKECRIIRDNLEEGNIENIRILAHRMKGSGKTLGFEKITEIGQALVEACKKQNSERKD